MAFIAYPVMRLANSQSFQRHEVQSNLPEPILKLITKAVGLNLQCILTFKMSVSYFPGIYRAGNYQTVKIKVDAH